MEQLMKKIQEAVKSQGIDLIGFADKSRFADVPAEHNPFSIFPDGKTVIMLGKRICRGALRGVEEGTNFTDYALFGSQWLDDEFMAIACYEMTRALEDEGWEAVPVFPNPTDIAPMGVPVEEGKPAPNVLPDFDYAAVACGICEISYNGIPFSKEYGSRQRFQMIITDAEIEPSPLLVETVCDKCGKCAEVCPLGAISTTETEEVDICGKKMTVAKIDFNKCRICKNGARLNSLNPSSTPDRVAALCNRTCLCHLEEAKLLKNQFETSFRKRETWAIDQDENYVEAKDAFNIHQNGISARNADKIYFKKG